MEPIKLEFIVKGDIEKDLARVQLAIKGVGDESYTSFKRLLGDSNEAFNSLSRDAQRQAVILQQVIQQLRQNEAAQEVLFNRFKQGTVSSKEYAEAQSRLSVQQAELKRQASELNRSVEREIQLNRVVTGSIQEKRTILQRLREEYAQLNKEERENVQIGGQMLNRIRELDRELKSLNGGLKETKADTSNLTDALEQIPGPIGNGVSQFRQLLSVGKTFMSSGIGVFVGGLTALFYGLKTAIEGSEEGTVKLTAKLENFKSQWTTHKRMLTEVAAGFYNLFTGDVDAANKNALAFRELKLNQTIYGKLAEEAAVNQNKINKEQERNNGLILANTAAIEKYRTQLMDVNKTFEERKKIGQEVLRLEKENAKLKLQPIAENYGNEFIRDQRTFELLSKEFPKQTELANKYFKTLTEGGELSLAQQHDLINAINDITAGLDKGWNDEQKAKFRSYFTDALTVTKEYYNKSREVSTNLSNIIKQQANETANANKKTALEKLQEEVKLYKEQYAILYTYERNMGKEAADEAFKELKAQGGDFISYLTNKINELKAKPTRTKEDDINLGYLQQTRQEATPKFDGAAFKNSIDEKKKLYKEDLDGYADYLTRLRRLMDQDETPAGTQKRIIIDIEIADVREEQQKNLNTLLNNYQTFTVAMASLEKTYQQDMARLSKAYQAATTEYDKKRYSDAMDARTNAYQTEVATMMAENASFTQVLFGDLERISRSALKKAITEAKKFIADWKKTAGELTPEMKALLDKIEQGINDAGTKLNSKLANGLQESAGFLQECASAASSFDENLGESLQTISELTNAIGQMAQGDYLAAGFTVVSSIIANIAKSNERSIAYAKQTEGAYWDAVNWKIERQIQLMKELNGISTGQVNKSVQELINELNDTLNNTTLNINKANMQAFGDKVLEGISKAKEKGNQFSVDFLEGIVRGFEGFNMDGKGNFVFYDLFKNLSQEQLIDLQGISEIWSILPEDIQNYIKQLSDAVDKQKELNEENKETLTNTTYKSVADSIAQGFLAGRKNASDFADDFRDLMRNAMIQSIKMKYLEAPLKEWYNRFAEASENGLTADKIKELQAQYDKIINSAGKEAEALKKITGVSLAQDAARTAVAKGLEAVSQDSFNEFTGRVYALQYVTSNIDKGVTNIQQILYKAAEQWVLIEENTRHCRRLEGMEKDLKTMKGDINKMLNNGIILRKQQ